MRRLIVLVLLAVITVGCASGRVTLTAEKMAAVKTIQVIDKTDALLLRGTDASMIADFVQTALRAKGYEPCAAPCQADATATVNVVKLSRHVSFNALTKSTAPKSVVRFTFEMHDKSGAVMMSRRISHSKSTEQRDLMVLSVQELAAYIPVAK